MEKLTKKIQYDSKETLVGVILCYKDNNGNHIEEINLDRLHKFRQQHNIRNESYSDICKEMLKYFNITLRPYEFKRTYIRIYKVYETRKYVKYD